MSISVKGTRDGVLLTLGGTPWSEALVDLAAQMKRPGAESFFRGARLILDAGEREINALELAEMELALEAHGVSLGTVLTTHPLTQEAAQQLGVATELPQPTREEVDDEQPPDLESAPPALGEEVLMIRRTVRSGQVIRYAGNVVVVGDVNPGGEVIASGDVFVWGRLRGMVHAGASGDDNAMVGALRLAPTQLRIGGHIAVAPEEMAEDVRPEIARVRDGRIVVEGWDG